MFNRLLILADYLSTIIFVGLSIILLIPISLFSYLTQYKNKKKLTKQEFENIISHWIVNNEGYLDYSKKDWDGNGNLIISILPKRSSSAVIKFKMTIDNHLFIMIRECWIEFSDYELNEKMINQILSAYKNGNYSIKEWYLTNELIDRRLHFILNGHNNISSCDSSTLIRRLFSQVKMIHFNSLSEVSP